MPVNIRTEILLKIKSSLMKILFISLTNSQHNQDQGSSDGFPVFFYFGMFPPELVRLGPSIVARVVLDQRHGVLRCGLQTVLIRFKISVTPELSYVFVLPGLECSQSWVLKDGFGFNDRRLAAIASLWRLGWRQGQ